MKCIAPLARKTFFFRRNREQSRGEEEGKKVQAEARKVLQAKTKQRLHGCVGAAKEFNEPEHKSSINFYSFCFCNIKPHFPIVLCSSE